MLNSVDEVDRGLSELSDTQKLSALKEQIKMRSSGLGWKDLHHPRSKNRVNYTWQHLAAHLKDTIIPEQQNRTLPSSPQPLLGRRVEKMFEFTEPSGRVIND
jgi:hypothetical protein